MIRDACFYVFGLIAVLVMIIAGGGVIPPWCCFALLAYYFAYLAVVFMTRGTSVHKKEEEEAVKQAQVQRSSMALSFKTVARLKSLHPRRAKLRTRTHSAEEKSEEVRPVSTRFLASPASTLAVDRGRSRNTTPPHPHPALHALLPLSLRCQGPAAATEASSLVEDEPSVISSVATNVEEENSWWYQIVAKVKLYRR